MPLVQDGRMKMRRLVDHLHAGSLLGFTSRPITDIVNIGIGGSDLGLVMAVEALAEYCHSNFRAHFVSNIDGVKISHVLNEVDPETTLFVVCSKSFTTQETLTNAQVVRDWLLEAGGAAAVLAGVGGLGALGRGASSPVPFAIRAGGGNAAAGAEAPPKKRARRGGADIRVFSPAHPQANTGPKWAVAAEGQQ